MGMRTVTPQLLATGSAAIVDRKYSQIYVTTEHHNRVDIETYYHVEDVCD
jgi:hypothetical protein